jgi:hypothetical protein
VFDLVGPLVALGRLINAGRPTWVDECSRRGSRFASVLGRGIAHLTIYVPALALYLIAAIYGFSTLGDPLQLLALGSVFLLATSFEAQADSESGRRVRPAAPPPQKN